MAYAFSLGLGGRKMRTPNLDLQAIEARAEKATAGPWVFERPVPSNYEEHFSAQVMAGSDPHSVSWHVVARAPMYLANAHFIAASRTDIPFLVAEVRRLRGLLEKAEELLNKIEHTSKHGPGFGMTDNKMRCVMEDLAMEALSAIRAGRGE